MMFRLMIFMFLASMTLPASIVEARVHRRSVGPVILDLGALPTLPVTTNDTQPPVAAGNLPSPPQVDGTPQTGKANPEPLAVEAIYPFHAQPLGALVLTRHPSVEAVEEIQFSVLFTDLEAQAPGVVAYYHPTLVGDHALLKPSVDTTQTPVAPDEPTAAEPDREFVADLKTEAVTTPPVERLRTLVVWVWRLLFFVGVGALTVTLLRRRRQTGQPISSPSFDDMPEPEFSQELVTSGILRDTDASLGSGNDSLSLRTGKSNVIGKPGTGSMAFGLIEPGAGRTARASGGVVRDQDS